MLRVPAFVFCCALAATASAAEVTLQNDSLNGGSSGAIQSGFVAGEMAASWLVSPCNGDLVAVQMFWRSGSGGAADSIQRGIHIFRAGTFPEPGAEALEIVGPVLTDGVINEYRYTDENSTIPVSVPVSANETMVVAFEFDTAPSSSGPSVVNDSDGLNLGHNAIYAEFGPANIWLSNDDLGVTGDWVIRAVVDCDNVPTQADIGIDMLAEPVAYQPGATLNYTISASNAGPAAAGVTVAALFPSSLQNVTWTCAASGAAACGLTVGAGNILQSVSMSMGGSVEYSVSSTVDASASGIIETSAAASPNPPVTDPDTSNNQATVSTPQFDNDLIFADGFDDAAA